VKPFALDQSLPRGIALLEASAGTGKTFSIAGLSLRLIAEFDIPVGELLIVTFTRAATAELAERIHKRLLSGARALRDRLGTDASDGPPEDPVLRALVQDASEATLRERLRRLEVAIASFDEAAISTIHGFCQRALQSAAFESATEFEVEMEADLGPLTEECVDDFMATAFVDAPADYYAILRKVAKLDRDAFLKLARELSADPGAQVLPRDPDPPLEVHAEAVDAFVKAWSSEGDDYVESLAAAIKGKEVKLSGSDYGAKAVLGLRDRVGAWVNAR
jgi:exodeoxyribonuclease V beta subunit